MIKRHFELYPGRESEQKSLILLLSKSVIFEKPLSHSTFPHFKTQIYDEITIVPLASDRQPWLDAGTGARNGR